jgi:hypothetical protein
MVDEEQSNPSQYFPYVPHKTSTPLDSQKVSRSYCFLLLSASNTKKYEPFSANVFEALYFVS